MFIPVTIAVLAILLVLAVALVALAAFMLVRSHQGRPPQLAFQAQMHRMSGRRREDEITQPLTPTGRQPRSAPTLLFLAAAARSDRARRDANEDDTLMMPLGDPTAQVQAGLYAVADGMGGYEKGEIASRTAVDAVEQAIRSDAVLSSEGQLRGDVNDEYVIELLRRTAAGANQRVYGVRLDEGSNMGTTLVLALVLRGKAYIGNVGDSRAYLVRDGEARRLTQDHSLVERMVTAGQLTEAEARLHPQRNLIFRSLGSDTNVEVDLFVEPLTDGDRLLLCSDGLSGPLTDQQLGHLASDQRDIEATCERLVAAALRAGGTDNISVVLVEARAA